MGRTRTTAPRTRAFVASPKDPSGLYVSPEKERIVSVLEELGYQTTEDPEEIPGCTLLVGTSSPSFLRALKRADTPFSKSVLFPFSDGGGARVNKDGRISVRGARALALADCIGVNSEAERRLVLKAEPSCKRVEICPIPGPDADLDEVSDAERSMVYRVFGFNPSLPLVSVTLRLTDEKQVEMLNDLARTLPDIYFFAFSQDSTERGTSRKLNQRNTLENLVFSDGIRVEISRSLILSSRAAVDLDSYTTSQTLLDTFRDCGVPLISVKQKLLTDVWTPESGVIIAENHPLAICEALRGLMLSRERMTPAATGTKETSLEAIKKLIS